MDKNRKKDGAFAKEVCVLILVTCACGYYILTNDARKERKLEKQLQKQELSQSTKDLGNSWNDLLDMIDGGASK